jgi:hypothetical protein
MHFTCIKKKSSRAIFTLVVATHEVPWGTAGKNNYLLVVEGLDVDLNEDLADGHICVCCGCRYGGGRK